MSAYRRQKEEEEEGEEEGEGEGEYSERSNCEMKQYFKEEGQMRQFFKDELIPRFSTSESSASDYYGPSSVGFSSSSPSSQLILSSTSADCIGSPVNSASLTSYKHKELVLEYFYKDPGTTRLSELPSCNSLSMGSSDLLRVPSGWLDDDRESPPQQEIGVKEEEEVVF
jgi:hypothetical protein